MTDHRELDLHDVQGNIIKAYPRFGYPRARYVFFRINDGQAGRDFLSDLLPLITTSAPWQLEGKAVDGSARPDVTTNVALTFEGLRRLGVPQASLQSFPEDFAGGMKTRRTILGDDGPSAPEKWDPIWAEPDPVHIFVALNASTQSQIEHCYKIVLELAGKQPDGVVVCGGHRGPDGTVLDYQDASAIFIGDEATPREHFGYVDGISNPFFKGSMSDSSHVVGGGKLAKSILHGTLGWLPLETGEFLLGYPDEAFEYPAAPTPNLLGDNGTYLVYRKLHQNVGAYENYLNEASEAYAGGREMLAAKMAGRWRNGAPLANFPTEEGANEFAEKWTAAKVAVANAKSPLERLAAKAKLALISKDFVDFDYRKDLDGGRCPVGAHSRRTHPRAALEGTNKGAFETPDALSNRRRILRRGMPYGDSRDRNDNAGEHGVIFMALGVDIARQFEFVQQQWINYGNDFKLGNDKDPLLGNHGTDESGNPDGRFSIESAKNDPNPPHFCGKIPRFVETRGGEYFFVPSLTALRMLADGIVDPT
jgi:Dyp-type peroxidase family